MRVWATVLHRHIQCRKLDATGSQDSRRTRDERRLLRGETRGLEAADGADRTLSALRHAYNEFSIIGSYSLPSIQESDEAVTMRPL